MNQPLSNPIRPGAEGERVLPSTPSAHTDPVRVFIVCDTQMLLAGLNQIYARWPRVEIVGSTGDPTRALELVESLRPDVVVLDFRRCGPIELAELATWKARSGGRILLVRSEAQVGSLHNIFAAGADGVLAQEADPKEAYLAMELLAAGHPFLSPKLRQFPFHRSRSDPLSCHLLRLLALGHSPSEIAEELDLDVLEVARRKEALLSSLGMPAPGELTRLAIREGLLPWNEQNRIAR